MYLKCIEMLGFKSFAEKTRLDFHPGVTSIVGPNGCGKSNVLDAVRWVLGEQSAKALRGSEMADVIFNGTDSRKQIGMAEVSMTFSGCAEALKTEYDEVTVTRRVFRDGKGEYELNKTPCRLRDIHHLFMDTGIGRTAYSIMEQGRIDKVLSSRPEDRREIFEEAAGITKFKAQRKEALRKLEYTDSNLVRLNDIIKEVSRQIGSLQRQANKARRYKEIHDRLRDLDLKLASRRCRQMNGRIGELEGAVGDLDRLIGEMDARIAAEEAELEQWRTHAGELESTIESSRQERAAKAAGLERAEGQTALNKERVADLDAADEAARADIAATEERIAAHEKELLSVEQEISAAGGELSACREALATAVRQMSEAAAHSARRREEIKECRERLAARERELQEVAGKIAGWDLEKRSHVLRVDAARKDAERARTQLDQEREANVSVEASLAAARVRRTEAGDALNNRKARLREVTESLSARNRKRAEVEQRMTALQSQLTLLKRMQTSRAGLGSAAQAVLAAAGKGALEGVEIKQALADVLKIAAGAEKAVGILLGERIEALLVADAEAVRKILAFLKSAEPGRLVLAPAQVPRVRWRGPAMPQSALNFVSAEGQAKELLETLLGHAYIADDLTGALALKAELPHAMVATRDGHLLTSEGILVSGSGDAGGQSAILTRNREIAEIEGQVEKVRRELEDAASEEDAVRIQRDEAEKRTEQASADLMTAEEGMRLVEREWHVWQLRREDLRRKIELIEGEIRHLGQTGEEMGEEERAQVRRRDELARTVEAGRNEVQNLEGGLPALGVRETDLNARVLELRVSGATLEEKDAGLQARREPIAMRLGELRETAAARHSIIKANAVRRSQYLEENEKLVLQADEHRGQISHLDEYLKALQTQRAASQEAIRERDEELKRNRRQHYEWQENRGKLDVELARIRIDRDTVAERILRDYRIDLHEYLAAPVTPPAPAPAEAAEGAAAPAEPAAPAAAPEAEPEPEPNWEQLEAEAGQLRERLEGMGPVNIEAITEYDELEARHRFLEEQQRDLLNSKEQLMQAIARINRTSRQLFAETFEQVNKNFQQTFSELFGGGKANLALMDDGDPLEAGIDISARPPGKQLTHVSLLSGGERTMTAVALLFAIYMVRPSPFCILDEMDAPLDESNINRFIDMLARFVKQSQFLLITHNKRTIGFADALYGITMEESGVSKVVSVRFRSREESAQGGGTVVDTARDSSAPPGEPEAPPPAPAGEPA